MIYDLKILNGNLELDFNPYTYEYTVTVEEDVKSLDFSYRLQDDTYIEIKNNELNDLENKVILEVYNVNEDATYTFWVYKEKLNDVSGIDNYMKSLEVNSKESIDLYKVEFLAVGVFFLLIITFSLIFHKKSQKIK